MDSTWDVISNSYRTNNISCQFTNLQIGSFTDVRSPHKQYPKLKGKGAECRDLTGPMLDAWQQLAHDDYPHKQAIEDMLCHQLGLQEILSEHKLLMFLPRSVVKAFRAHIDELLMAYQKMAAQADSDGDLLWNIPTKWHMLWHLGQRSQFINPRRAATMMNEDFVCNIKDLTHSCAAGTQLHQMAMKGYEKYRWGSTFLEGVGLVSSLYL